MADRGRGRGRGLGTRPDQAGERRPDQAGERRPDQAGERRPGTRPGVRPGTRPGTRPDQAGERGLEAGGYNEGPGDEAWVGPEDEAGVGQRMRRGSDRGRDRTKQGSVDPRQADTAGARGRRIQREAGGPAWDEAGPSRGARARGRRIQRGVRGAAAPRTPMSTREVTG